MTGRMTRTALAAGVIAYRKVAFSRYSESNGIVFICAMARMA
jgi:hypothetical protein